MTRTFSLPSEALSFYLGYALLHNDRIAIISPWVSDVQVSFPVNNRDMIRRMYLSEAIREFDGETEVKILFQTGQEHNNYINARLADSVEVETVDDLHAKAIVTQESVYIGSANITYGGLSINRELCHIVENEYPSIEDYINAELDL